jgi:flagellar hook-associated protein FlgK
MSKVLSGGRLSVIMLLAVSVALTAACKKNANTGNAGTSDAGATTNTATKGGGGAAAAGSPTAVVRAYYEAALRKDIPAEKRYLSAGTMRMMEDGAKQLGKTADEIFEEGARQMPITSAPELSNEQINGDTATVDVDILGHPLTMQLVKEGGEWKIAMDKTLQNMGAPAGGTTDGSAPTMPEGGGGEDEHDGHEEK